MSLRFPSGNDPNDIPRTDRQITDLISKEQASHLFVARGAIAACSCGQVFNTPQKWRHDVHVKEVLRAYEDRLRGVDQ